MAEYNASLIRKSQQVLDAIRRYEDKHLTLKETLNRQLSGCVNRRKPSDKPATIFD